MSELQDGGKRETYRTGAIREPATGKGRFDLIPPQVLRRLALHYENGAKKYPPHNWEQGIPFSRCVDSAMRHLNQYRLGDTTEDHLIASVWNILAMVFYQETDRMDLDDLPNYGEQ